MSRLEIIPIPALNDNYAYLLHDQATGKNAVVDPSEAEPVLRALDVRGWGLDLVVNTHHHHDHIGGNLVLKQRTRCRIAGPRINNDQIPGMDIEVSDGESIEVGGAMAWAMGIPGHTLGHTAYWFADSEAVFTGDTLFLMGCGRLFEGTPDQMWSSLKKLMALPDTTRVYCGHEYTEKNAEFALGIEPQNSALRERQKHIQKQRAEKKITVPGTIGEEKATNPFLRVQQRDLRRNLNMVDATDVEVFAKIRQLKDNYR